jgi:DNA topoisomerase-1
VASVVKRCEELPGQRLFQYIDSNAERRTVHSDEVNDYLRLTTGEDYTAKDFRTWAATVLAFCALRDAARADSGAEAKRNMVAAIDSVARRLGHTRTVCRRSYIHPAIIEMCEEGSLERAVRVMATKPHRSLKADEAAVLALLKRATSRLARAA